MRVAGLAVILLAAGCSLSPPATVSRQLPVQASSFALAEMVRRVGLSRVILSDHAALVADSAVAGPQWLDPVAVQAVPAMVAAFLADHDPGGRSVYAAAARAYAAQLGALEIDYRSSLADCARPDLITADTAFAPTAARYGFVDHAASAPGVADLIRRERIPVVFTETGASANTVPQVAAATGARVEQLDTTRVRTPAEAARGATYLSLMTDNLAKLRTALACAAA
ncbi:MAG TPA: zinc ABC transporter substrate-binding protein [Acidimicrobiales bacterium]|nr:zinc ABC transporter substrate-binding protein [Acidimicrobiales bacterium]